MNAINGLQPKTLWKIFSRISAIPRESKNEKAVRDFIIDMAVCSGLTYDTDTAGNVLIRKGGSLDKGTIILQSHMDMVCEKDENTIHDFTKDPIRLIREDGYITAAGTTLGADNGIGMAAMLTVMEDKTLTHPDLELLFTVDEETGLNGACGLEQGFLSGMTLINLDSEEEGTFYIGCAGGRDTELSKDLSYTRPPQQSVAVSIKITGLKGGHSGADIHKGLANAIKLMARFLKKTIESIPYGIEYIRGGSRHNVIPRESEALIHISPEDINAFRHAANEWNDIFAREFEGIDNSLSIIVMEATESGMGLILSHKDAIDVLDILIAVPHGHQRTDQERFQTVITSTNLATCSMEDKELMITTSQRSIMDSGIDDISSQVQAVGELSGCNVIHNHDYPAWKPNPDSAILAMAKDAYYSLHGQYPQIKVIHAGLECGVIGNRIPGIDMISLGPTIEHAHSPSERVDIASVEKMWVFLIHLLKYPGID